MRYSLIKDFDGVKAPVYVCEPNSDLTALKLNNCVVVDVPKVCKAIFPLESFKEYINRYGYDFERKKTLVHSYYRHAGFSDVLNKVKATYTTYFEGKLFNDERVCVACPKRLEQLTMGEDDQNYCFRRNRCDVDFAKYPFTWNKSITKLIKTSFSDITGASRRSIPFFEVNPSADMERLNTTNRQTRGAKGATTRRLGKTKCVDCYFERSCSGKERNARKTTPCHTTKKALNRKLRQWSVRRFGSYDGLLKKMAWQGTIVPLEEENHWSSARKNIKNYEVVCPVNSLYYLVTPVKDKERDGQYRYRSLSGKLVPTAQVEAIPQAKIYTAEQLDKNAKLVMFMMAISKKPENSWRSYNPALGNHKPAVKDLNKGYHGYYFNSNSLVNINLKRGAISVSTWEDVKSIRHLVEVFKEYGRNIFIERLLGQSVV